MLGRILHLGWTMHGNLTLIKQYILTLGVSLGRGSMKLLACDFIRGFVRDYKHVHVYICILLCHTGSALLMLCVHSLRVGASVYPR